MSVSFPIYMRTVEKRFFFLMKKTHFLSLITQSINLLKNVHKDSSCLKFTPRVPKLFFHALEGVASTP